MTLRHRLIALLLLPLVATSISCRNVGESMSSLVAQAQNPFGQNPPAADPFGNPAPAAPGAQPANPANPAAAPGAPAELVPQAVVGDRVQKIGQPPKTPIVGQKLPTLPRDEGMVAGSCPQPFVAYGPFVPPGIKGPWPMDEYLHDGGDKLEPVSVSPEWQVQGLNVDDTVAHYDTQDGRVKVEATNCAYVYAPRFSSVRCVLQVTENEIVTGPNNLRKPERAVRYEEKQLAYANIEQQQPIGQTANLRPGLYARDQRDGVASVRVGPTDYRQSFHTYEDFLFIRTGAMQSADKARLAEATDAAIVWSKDDGVNVFVDKQRAALLTGDQRAQAIFTVKEPVNGKLRICKIASTAAAQPGDFVEFTLRYDNVGDQALGNIVILDSLTTRLEYVQDSAQSSRSAHFMTNPNAAESLELRWEIDEPLMPGDGGLVRFKCKVR